MIDTELMSLLRFKKGLSHLILPVTLFAIFALLTVARPRIYTAYQHLGPSFGINFNNIAGDSYVSWIKSQPEVLENTQNGIFLNKIVSIKDATSIQAYILGEQYSSGEKWVEIDLSDQKLYMKEGTNTVGNFLVSTGKFAPTPVGEWKIWTKLRYTRMRGGSKALGTFYDLPNVPYTMYYYRGYGIHGAYWHNDFGRPRSHGCVNMKPEEAGVVFNWASVGTRVVVHQ